MNTSTASPLPHNTPITLPGTSEVLNKYLLNKRMDNEGMNEMMEQRMMLTFLTIVITVPLLSFSLLSKILSGQIQISEFLL